MADAAGARAARRIIVGGRVQGVGFRPFVYRIAGRLELCGWVRNDAGLVTIHAEGRPEDLVAFEAALTAEAPPLARPVVKGSMPAACEATSDFAIVTSASGGQADIHLPPDLFCCDACLEELRDPKARRYRYPFTNCTQCGPRYTIIKALPYDRPATSMAGFALCPQCRAEYEDPADRRFHAEPLACSTCGPTLSLVRDGRGLAEGAAALAGAVEALKAGEIVAVRGVGGYHLMCDAAGGAAVERLRARKRRPDKPLAVMFPQEGADGLDAVRRDVSPGAEEAAAIASPERPIVLVPRRPECALADELAPGLSELGVFLPYSPLHHLLLADFGGPLVATSGNVSGEPVITDPHEAETRLGGIADVFLHHDRPIVRPADDTVVRVIAGAPCVIRAGRGMAPVEIELPAALDRPLLAAGGHMKAAVALGWDARAVVSPHVGDLESLRALDVMARVAQDLQDLYRVRAETIVCDLHPQYASSRWARRQGKPVVTVQHHIAHASGLAAEHGDISEWLIFSWDGTGLGTDGTLWGGEAFIGGPGHWRRVASFRPFHLVGGDAAGREPWRAAAALLWETGADWLPEVEGAGLARQAWDKGVNAVTSSSAGRLFDAAAALVLGRDAVSFEGQGPMMLEAIASDEREAVEMPAAADEAGVLRIDWSPLLPVLRDGSLSQAARASVFHESLTGAVVRIFDALAADHDIGAVGLTGGVFQNRRLGERVVAALGARGIQVHLPRILPANDGGLAFGQIVEVLAGGGTSI